MKIVENSYDRLVIIVRPWLGLALFLGLAIAAFRVAFLWNSYNPTAAMFFLAGVFLLMVAGAHAIFVDVTFDRTKGEIEYNVRKLARTKTERYRLATIERALVQTAGSGKGMAQRLAIANSYMQFPLEPSHSIFDRTRFSAEVNAWLVRTS